MLPRHLAQDLVLANAAHCGCMVFAHFRALEGGEELMLRTSVDWCLNASGSMLVPVA